MSSADLATADDSAGTAVEVQAGPCSQHLCESYCPSCPPQVPLQSRRGSYFSRVARAARRSSSEKVDEEPQSGLPAHLN